MAASFSCALHALLPLFILMLWGYVAVRIGKLDTAFCRKLNQFCFRYFLPIQLFQNVYAIENLTEINWRVIGYILLSIPVLLALGILVAKLFVADPGRKGVLVQAVFRSNIAVIGLPIAAAIGNASAGAFSSVTTALVVPTFNILAVVVLTYYGSSKQKLRVSNFLKKIIQNPLVIGTFFGLVAVVIRQFLPTVNGEPFFSIQRDLAPIYQTIQMVSKIASPVMLFCLGACLDFKAAADLLPEICLGLIMRLLLVPILIIGCAVLLKDTLGMTAVEFPALIAFSASPVAVSSAAMAQESGCDDQYAGQLIVWSSVLSLFTIFGFILAQGMIVW